MDFIDQYLDGLCRTCLIEVEASSYGNNIRPQWQSILDRIEECDTLRIAELLSTAVPQIQIQPSDELPKKICRECLQQLLGAYRFQQMCVQSEEQMRELVSTKHTEFKMSIMEAFKEHELETSDTDSIALETAHSSSSHQNLEHPSIQKPLHAISVQITEDEAVQSSSLENIIKGLQSCNDEEGCFNDFIKNEPVKDEDDTMHSTNSIECKEEKKNLSRDEIIELEAAQSSAADPLESIDQLLEHCKDSQGVFSEFIINECIKEEDDTMHSTISIEYKEEINMSKGEIIEPETTQSSAANQLEGMDHLPEHCKDSQAELSPFIKNEPIEDDEPSIKYGDGYIIHSTISVAKEEVLATELEEQQVNMKLSQLKCNLCNKSFRKLEYLERHQELHKTKGDKFQKYVSRRLRCYKDTSSQSPSLDRITRGENKPYECPYCPLRFRTSNLVKYHKQIHEGVKQEACDICSKKMRKQDLKKHKLTHIKEKLHKCDYCEKRFASILRLQLHRRTHTGEKPFKCKYCEGAYSTRPNLNSHLRTHLGDNVYRCEFCPLAFASASERRLHLVSHKNEDPETRERNIKALEEDEAKLRLRISNEKTQQPSTEESDQQLKDRIRRDENKPYECPYCPMRFHSINYVRVHKEIHEGVKRVACDICGKQMRKSNLKKHKLIHSKEKLHKCDICEKRFRDTQQLRIHSRTHTGEKPFKCKYCELAFSRHYSLNTHLRTHLGDNIYKCEFCPVAFASTSERRFHLISHKNEDPETRERNIKALEEDEAKLRLRISNEKTQQPSTEESDQQLKDRIRRDENKPYECPYCPKRFHYSSCVKMHKQIHEGVKRVACDICVIPLSKWHLKTHKLVHSNEKLHKCDICEKRFRDTHQLRVHRRRHTGERPYKCQYCECAYTSSDAVVKHLRTHLGDNIYRCEFCPSAFPLASECRLHFATHKNEDPETRERNIKALEEDEAKLRLRISNEKTQQPSTLKDRIRRDENKPYECPYCPKRFHYSNCVRMHIEIHEGVKRVACDICGKQMKKQNLNKHKLLHSEEKLHKCDLCEKRFRDTQQLRIHRRRHTGEKPFKCKYCERAYVASADLIKHLRNHLGDNVFRCQFCPSAFPLASERRLHLLSHKNEDPETRERNIKALEEDEAKLRLRISNEKTQQPSTEESDQKLKDRTRHDETKPYECPYCPLRFRTIHLMKSHKQIHEGVEREAHSKEKPHKCYFCEMRFISIQELRLHTNKHNGEKTFKCRYCECAYYTLAGLNKHLRTHLGVNIYRCEFCPSAFPLASERRLHLLSHKNEDPETREQNIKALEELETKLRLRISNEKTQQPSREESEQQLETQVKDIIADRRTTHIEDNPCEYPYFPLRFSSKSSASRHEKVHGEAAKHRLHDDLKDHKPIHSKETTYKCELCGKRFPYMQYLQIHIRTHTGEKKYKCKYCERGFATSSTLMNHLRIHLGKNIHRCTFCPLAFPSSAELHVHLISHKNEDPEARERNLKALLEEEAKIVLKCSKERSKGQTT